MTAPLTLQAPTDVGLDTARQFGRTLTTRMDLGAPRDGDMPEGFGAYLVGDTFTRTIDATDRNDQFKVDDRRRSPAGVEYGFGSGIVGAALNYLAAQGQFRAMTSSATRPRRSRAALYGGFGIAGGFVQGYGAIGRDRP